MRLLCAVCFAALLSPSAVSLSAQNARPWQVPASLCGLSFLVSDRWIVSRDSVADRESCRGEVKSRFYEKHIGDNDPSHFWMISVEVIPKKVEDAMEYYDVHREGDRWFVGEGARESPAYEIKGPGWWGLRVDSFGIRSGSRGSVGSFESNAVWVLISETGGNRTGHLMAGSGADDELLNLILSSLRFERK